MPSKKHLKRPVSAPVKPKQPAQSDIFDDILRDMHNVVIVKEDSPSSSAKRDKIIQEYLHDKLHDIENLDKTDVDLIKQHINKKKFLKKRLTVLEKLFVEKHMKGPYDPVSPGSELSEEHKNLLVRIYINRYFNKNDLVQDDIQAILNHINKRRREGVKFDEDSKETMFYEHINMLPNIHKYFKGELPEVQARIVYNFLELAEKMRPLIKDEKAFLKDYVTPEKDIAMRLKINKFNRGQLNTVDSKKVYNYFYQRSKERKLTEDEKAFMKSFVQLIQRYNSQ